jgi:hypothetical protein
MHAGRVGGFRIAGLPYSDVAGDTAQLAGQVLPLTDPQVVQELLTAHPPKGAARQCLSLLTQIPPQIEIGHEVGVLVGEPGMLLPRRLFAVGRAFTRIGDRQGRGEHQHLAHTAFGVGLQDHPAKPRVDR